jgi:hypothetical protein
MGQGMRVTVDAAMRARDVSRILPENEPPQPPKPSPRASSVRRAEKRRLAKRGATPHT